MLVHIEVRNDYFPCFLSIHLSYSTGLRMDEIYGQFYVQMRKCIKWLEEGSEISVQQKRIYSVDFLDLKLKKNIYYLDGRGK